MKKWLTVFAIVAFFTVSNTVFSENLPNEYEIEEKSENQKIIAHYTYESYQTETKKFYRQLLVIVFILVVLSGLIIYLTIE